MQKYNLYKKVLTRWLELSFLYKIAINDYFKNLKKVLSAASFPDDYKMLETKSVIRDNYFFPDTFVCVAVN